MSNCRYLLGSIPKVKVNYCYQEANQCIDILAKNGAYPQEDFTSFVCPPSDIVMLLYFDAISMYHKKLCQNFIALN